MSCLDAESSDSKALEFTSGQDGNVSSHDLLKVEITNELLQGSSLVLWLKDLSHDALLIDRSID